MNVSRFNRRFITLPLLFAFVAIGALMLSAMLAGCDSTTPSGTATAAGQVQQGAAIVGYITQPGAPTSQPANLTPAEQSVRTIVQQVGAVVPWGGQILAGIALAAGAVGAVAGAVAGNKTSNASFASVVMELATSATGWVEGEWSTVTSNALAKQGLTNVVAATPTTPAAPAAAPSKIAA
jgi:hypothetical protein